MDVKLFRFGALLVCALQSGFCLGGTFSTENFVVSAPTDEIARKVAHCAEFWRKDLAIQWLGKPLPNWYRPCPVKVKVGQIGAGGATTFTFENGEVFGWKMSVQGSLERILDSVVPHEVNHTIFASYFRRPLPRWADEGAATLVEHESERNRQTRLLDQVMNTSRRIPLRELLQIREYPKDMHQVLTLYAEGYSLAEFLVGQKGEQGRSIYLKFLHTAHQRGWEHAIRTHYPFAGVADLEKKWSSWILAGSPTLETPPGQMLADADSVPQSVSRTVAGTDPARSRDDVEIRAQSPDPEPLAMIPRSLRVGRTVPTGTGSSAMRTVQLTEYPLSHVNRGSDHDFRTRTGDELDTGPSLLPTHPSPPAYGIFSEATGDCYAFPERR